MARVKMPSKKKVESEIKTVEEAQLTEESKPIKKVIVIGDKNLRVRSKPDMGAPVLFKVPPNTILIVNEVLDHWLNVCAFNGAKCGYVSRIFTEVVE